MAGPEDAKARPLARGAAVLAVALLAFVGYRLARGPAEDAPAPPETTTASRARDEARGGEDRRDARDGDRVAAYDPARLVPLLVDGGAAPATVEGLDVRLAPPLPSGAPMGLEPAAPTETEAAPVSTAAVVEWRREPTVESDLRRAVFLRDLLERQIDDTRARADAARARGDGATAARYERRLERLTRERPAIEARVGELEAEAIAEEPPPGDDHGSY